MPVLLIFCGGILAFAGILFWLLRLFMRRGSREFIMLDGAVCKQMHNGNVQIAPRTFFNLIATLILILPFVGMMVPVIAGGAELGPLLLCSLGAGVPIYFALSALYKSQKVATITFNTQTQVVEIGRWRSVRRIPFSDIERIEVRSSPMPQAMLQGTLTLILTTGERIRLGSISGTNKQVQKSLEMLSQMLTEFIPT